jgi:hypothetical protein
MGDSTVCPESTLESATQSNYVRKTALKQSGWNRSSRPACESSIESANRRGFIKKAALVAAAAAVGSTVLGGKLVPESSAKSALCSPTYTDVYVTQGVYADIEDLCNGNPCLANRQGVFLGGCCFCGFYPGGEGIGSQRNCSTVKCGSTSYPPGHNLYGLDFYTHYKKRMSITNSGSVGIGTGCNLLSSGVVLCVRGGSVGISKPFLPSCSSSPALYVSANGISGCKTFPVIGISGTSACPTYGIGVAGGSKIGVCGTSSIMCGVGVRGTACGPESIPIVAKGLSSQTGNLQQWEKGCTVKSVVNKCGWLGLGAVSAPTTLTVGGSVSARTVAVTKNYKMGASDFAVLASGKIKVTLPPASTASGMIVFVKNISTSTVTIEAFNDKNETDTIEGASLKNLKKQYDSLQLVSNGTNEWFILSGSLCGAFTS